MTASLPTLDRRIDERLVGLPASRATLGSTAACASSGGSRRRCSALFDEGLLNGTTHACIGQEADASA